jgi:hypothetical protein
MVLDGGKNDLAPALQHPPAKAALLRCGATPADAAARSQLTQLSLIFLIAGLW